MNKLSRTRRLRRRYPTGLPSSQTPSLKTVMFEPLEPRMLLAADLGVLGVAIEVDGETVFGPMEASTPISVFDVPIEEYGPGQQLNLKFTLVNIGNEDVEQTQFLFPEFGIVWSEDAIIDSLDSIGDEGMDQWVEVVRVEEAIPADDPETEELDFPVAIEHTTFIPPWVYDPVIGGVQTGYFGIVADPLNRVSEDNEENNATEPPVAVPMFNGLVDIFGFDMVMQGTNIDLNDPYIATLPGSLEGPVAAAGQTIDFTYAIRQSGQNENTQPWTTEFYLSTPKFLAVDTIDPAEDHFLGTDDWISGMTGDQWDYRRITVTLPDRDDPFYDSRGVLDINTWYKIGQRSDPLGEVVFENAPYFTGAPMTINNSNIGAGGPLEVGMNTLNDIDRFFDQALLFIWVKPDTHAENIVVADTDLIAGALTDVNVDIVNISKIDARPFDVTFHISTDGEIVQDEDPMIGRYRFTQGLEGQTIESITQEVTLPDEDDGFWTEVGSGPYYIGVIVNPPISTNPVELEEEDGNYIDNANVGLGSDIAAVTVTGVGGGLPVAQDVDLRGVVFDVTATSLVTGGGIQIDFEIENGDIDDSRAFFVNFYVSSDEQISADDDSLIGSLTVGDFNTGAGVDGLGSTGLLSAVLSLPNSHDAVWNGDGMYYIGMIVDGENSILETDESNNTNQGMGLDLDQVSVTVVTEPDTAPNKKKNARKLGRAPQAPNSKEITEFVGQSDRVDWFMIRAKKATRLELNLTMDEGNANMKLVSASGKRVVAKSRNRGNADERILRNVGRGKWFVKVNSVGGKNTVFDLEFSANDNARPGSKNRTGAQHDGGNFNAARRLVAPIIASEFLSSERTSTSLSGSPRLLTDPFETVNLFNSGLDDNAEEM